METGALIDGKYRLIQRLGEGGFGEVWEAENEGRRCAVKCLHPELMRNEAVVTRFFREAIAAAAITSAHLVKVEDWNLHPEGGHPPYLVMEYLAGRDLASVLEDEGLLEPARAVGLLLQVCSALAVAHRKGIVHRDLKPENIFLTTGDDGSELVKVLDLGVAKFQDEMDLTSAGATIGTPLYMSPDLFSAGKDAVPRDDVFSLGVILYELLTGHLPCVKPSVLQIVGCFMSCGYARPREHRPELDEGLERIVLRAMEAKAEDRFGSVDEFAAALAPYVGEAPVAPPPPVDARRSRRWPWILGVGAASTAALLVFMALWVSTIWIGRDEPVEQQVSQDEPPPNAVVVVASEPDAAAGSTVAVLMGEPAEEPSEALPSTPLRGGGAPMVNHFEAGQSWEGAFNCGVHRGKMALCIDGVTGDSVVGKLGMGALTPEHGGRGYPVQGLFEPATGKVDLNWDEPQHRGGTGIRGRFEREGSVFLGVVKSSSCQSFYLEQSLTSCETLDASFPGIAKAAPPSNDPLEAIARAFPASLENHFETGQRWGGMTQCGSKTVKLLLHVDRVDGHAIVGRLELSPSIAQPWRARGLYHVEGRFVPEDGGVRMKAGDWIGPPPDLPRLGFGGQFNSGGRFLQGAFHGEGCDAVSFWICGQPGLRCEVGPVEKGVRRESS